MDNHKITGLPTPTDDTDAVPKSYVDAADIRINKSLSAKGWYKVGSIWGEMCGVATLTIGGAYKNNQASPSMVNIATQLNIARLILQIPSYADNQISMIGVCQEDSVKYGVYAYYNSTLENPVSINVHVYMGTFSPDNLDVSSLQDSDMTKILSVYSA
jgi:hypothetical protein